MNPKDNIERSPVPPIVAIKVYYILITINFLFLLLFLYFSSFSSYYYIFINQYPATVCSIEECCHLGVDKDEDDTGLRIRAERLILGFKHSNQTVVNFFEQLHVVSLIEEIIQDGSDPVDVVMEILKDQNMVNYYKKEYSLSN